MSTGILSAQNLVTPQPSTTQTVKQNFSTGFIELSYSRPNAKGREIFGNLVPFGQVWRTGANNATTLTFSEAVNIGGVDVKPGKYGLLTIPGKNEWTIIISKDVDVTSPAAYKMENDIVRVKVQPQTMPFKMETFGIFFNEVTNSSINVDLVWDDVVASLPITTNTDERIMAQIDRTFNQDTKPYFAAASYYYDNGKDLKKAKEWAAKAIEAQPQAFWMHMLKARVHAKLGEKAEAKASALKTVELATTAKNGDYIKMGNDLIKSL